ncbi:MAG: HupE/UreJ family protein [Xanthomonadales bacterium]|nr:HupE/UreJ family protein [Xanthomonadales bacterium]
MRLNSRVACWGRVLLLPVLGWLAAVPTAQAHESRPAYLELKETGPGQYSVLWRTPVLSGQRLNVVLTMPAGVQNLREPVVLQLPDSLLERRWISAGPEGLAGKRIEFVSLQFTITDVLARVELEDGRSWTTIARPATPWIEVTAARSAWQVAGDYVLEGIRHILFAADHLLFVLGLLLIVRDGWTLVKTITAFTVAHSITLAATTLGYVSVPAPPVEAAIAFSILFLGPEIVRRWQGETSFTIRNPWVVAFAFGLLHGFGFATALTSAGLPPSDVPLALVCFNVGVELGQLTFVALIVLLERALSRAPVVWPRWVMMIPGYAVGSMGAFWTIQRVNLWLRALG